MEFEQVSVNFTQKMAVAPRQAKAGQRLARVAAVAAAAAAAAAAGVVAVAGACQEWAQESKEHVC